MKTIEGTRYISAKEYAQMMNLTAGRVSQIKSELPFEKFEEFGIELINFDLLELSQSEKSLAQAKFQTTTPIHELSYKDMGNYFAKLLMDLVIFRGSADMQIKELQDKLGNLAQNFDVLENQNLVLSTQLSATGQEIACLTSSLLTAKEINQCLSSELEEFKLTNQELNTQLDNVSKEHNDLKVIYNEAKHEMQIKIIEINNLSSQNEQLKARLAAMEATAKSDADFKEEFKNFKELVMNKIK